MGVDYLGRLQCLLFVSPSPLLVPTPHPTLVSRPKVTLTSIKIYNISLFYGMFTPRPLVRLKKFLGYLYYYYS